MFVLAVKPRLQPVLEQMITCNFVIVLHMQRDDESQEGRKPEILLWRQPVQTFRITAIVEVFDFVTDVNKWMQVSLPVRTVFNA
jgi:hypothetical protein